MNGLAFQRLVQQLITSARREALALIKRPRLAVRDAQLQLQAHAAVTGERRFQRGEECGPDSARTHLRQHEELVDLPYEALVLEAQDLHPDGIAQKLWLRLGYPGRSQLGRDQEPSEQRFNLWSLETGDSLEIPVALDQGQELRDVGGHCGSDADRRGPGLPGPKGWHRPLLTYRVYRVVDRDSMTSRSR